MDFNFSETRLLIRAPDHPHGQLPGRRVHHVRHPSVAVPLREPREQGRSHVQDLSEDDQGLNLLSLFCTCQYFEMLLYRDMSTKLKDRLRGPVL